jgi:broad specificity phosphatase PhoE
MKIILIRHGESEANAQGIMQGQKVDKSLSKLGREQATKLAKRLKNEKIEAIYSSDLKRAKETAEEINKFHNVKIKLDKRLREKDHDKEHHKEHEERCKSFLAEIKHKGTIVIVAHGGTNRIILALSTENKEKGSKLFNLINQGNTCVNILEKQGKHYKIRLINCLKHLE